MLQSDGGIRFLEICLNRFWAQLLLHWRALKIKRLSNSGSENGSGPTIPSSVLQSKLIPGHLVSLSVISQSECLLVKSRRIRPVNNIWKSNKSLFYLIIIDIIWLINLRAHKMSKWPLISDSESRWPFLPNLKKCPLANPEIADGRFMDKQMDDRKTHSRCSGHSHSGCPIKWDCTFKWPTDWHFVQVETKSEFVFVK